MLPLPSTTVEKSFWKRRDSRVFFNYWVEDFNLSIDACERQEEIFFGSNVGLCIKLFWVCHILVVV